MHTRVDTTRTNLEPNPLTEYTSKRLTVGSISAQNEIAYTTASAGGADGGRGSADRQPLATANEPVYRSRSRPNIDVKSDWDGVPDPRTSSRPTPNTIPHPAYDRAI